MSVVTYKGNFLQVFVAICFKKIDLETFPLQHLIIDKYILLFKKTCPSSLRHRDSNPQPLEHESSPITTRPGIPAFKQKYSLSYALKVFLILLRERN